MWFHSKKAEQINTDRVSQLMFISQSLALEIAFWKQSSKHNFLSDHSNRNSVIRQYTNQLLIQIICYDCE